jgi:hypothetical protein
MHRISTFVTAVLAATPLLAQTTIVPSAVATKSPGYYTAYFFYGTTSTSIKNESRTQTLYDAADVSSTVRSWSNMEFRRPQELGNQNAATSGTMKLTLSSSTTAYTAASPTFASNTGTPATTVFNGTINLPARNRGTSWPDPWETAVPFTSPWLYIPMTGGSLVVENEFSGSTSMAAWYVENGRAEVGTRVTNLSGCSAHSDGGRNNSISHRNPVLGGSWYVYYNSMPSNVPSLAASFQIIAVGGVGSSQWGMTLPIPLSTLFLPSNGCSLAVQDQIRVPMTYLPSTAGPNRGSLRGPTVPIPNIPTLAGVSFFDQGVCTDTNATTNAPEIYMTWSSKWTIGSGLGNPVAMVYRSGDNSQPSGSVRQFEGPSLRFN